MKTVIKGFKYRIYPNPEQEVMLAKTFGSCRFVYNHILSMRIEAHKNESKSMSKTDCNNFCNREMKKEFEWLKEVDKFALTNAIFNLDSAYQNFFREIKKGNKNQGFPKFKSKRTNYNSYTTNFTNNNIKAFFDDGLVQLPKVGKIKAKLHRKFDGRILFATVSKVPSGKYFVSFNVECEHSELPINDSSVGIDLGVKEFAIDTNGIHIDNPEYLKQYEDKLAKLQRQHSKKVKGSNNFKKHSKKVAKLHERIANLRTDFQHKLSSKIINDNQVIVTEDLFIKGMVRNSRLAKSISDVAWGEFTRQLGYKASWNDRLYHKINPWFASSQLCSDCGHKNKEVKCLSIREWMCSECGSTHDRDENAAKNILNEGLRELGLLM